MTVRVNQAIPQNPTRQLFARLAQDDDGQDLVEYALIALAMGLTTVAGVHGLGAIISADFNLITTGFNSAVI